MSERAAVNTADGRGAGTARARPLADGGPEKPDRFPAWREPHDCIWCHRPLVLREYIRPGGIPTYHQSCDCEGAEHAVAASIAPTLFPASVGWLLMRATP